MLKKYKGVNEYMTYPEKGGKGKKFEPGITHVRVPVPLKEVVAMLVQQYRQRYGGVVDPAGGALIQRVETAIISDGILDVNGYASDSIDVNEYSNGFIGVNGLEDKLAACEENCDALREENIRMHKRLSEVATAADQLASERDQALHLAESLRQQLEVARESQSAPQPKANPKAVQILKEALAFKANAGGAIKREIERALALLISQ